MLSNRPAESPIRKLSRNGLGLRGTWPRDLPVDVQCSLSGGIYGPSAFPTWNNLGGWNEDLQGARLERVTRPKHPPASPVFPNAGDAAAISPVGSRQRRSLKRLVQCCLPIGEYSRAAAESLFRKTHS
jgi:hypothetical protein